jgi:hypothetical protein
MTTSKGIKPQETRDLTWKTPSTREGKTTGASQQELHYIGSPVTTPTAAAYKKRMNQYLQWKTLMGIYDPYRTAGG